MGADPMVEEAAGWRIRLEEGTADRGEFETWLGADPRRRQQFEKVESVWDVFEGSDDEPLMRQTRKELLDRLALAKRRRRSMMIGSVAAGLAAVAVLAALFMGLTTQTNVYETPVQGPQRVRLADGSTVLLDARSRLVVRYSPSRRELTLQRGQARFDVAHDAHRLFTVAAGTERVIATGTAFNVELSGSGMAVSLLEGRVRIVPRSGPEHQAVNLRQGEQLVSDAAGRRVSRFDADATTAWETGRIVFNDTPLDEAVGRVGRYAAHPIVLSDPSAARFRVNGVFRTGDTFAFAEAVATLLPIQAACEARGAIRLTVRDRTAPPSRANAANLDACRQRGELLKVR